MALMSEARTYERGQVDLLRFRFGPALVADHPIIEISKERLANCPGQCNEEMKISAQRA